MEKELSHFNENGEVHMIDVGEKPITNRVAIAKGEILSKKNIQRIRPGFGLHPKYFHSSLGKIAKKDLQLKT